MLLKCGVGEDSWESLGQKEIQPVHPKGNQSWIFIRKTDADAETPILWPPYAKNWLTGKHRDAGKNWRQEERKTTKVRWLDGITNSMDMNLSNSGRWWWKGRPGVLQSMGSERVGHNFAAEQKRQLQTNITLCVSHFSIKLRKKVLWQGIHFIWQANWPRR